MCWVCLSTLLWRRECLELHAVEYLTNSFVSSSSNLIRTLIRVVGVCQAKMCVCVCMWSGCCDAPERMSSIGPDRLSSYGILFGLPLRAIEIIPRKLNVIGQCFVSHPGVPLALGVYNNNTIMGESVDTFCFVSN